MLNVGFIDGEFEPEELKEIGCILTDKQDNKGSNLFPKPVSEAERYLIDFAEEL